MFWRRLALVIRLACFFIIVKTPLLMVTTFILILSLGVFSTVRLEILGLHSIFSLQEVPSSKAIYLYLVSRNQP